MSSGHRSVAVRLDNDRLAELEQAAEAAGLDRSAWIREAIAEKLGRRLGEEAARLRRLHTTASPQVPGGRLASPVGMGRFPTRPSQR